jgi:alkylated DNA repair dioxygenase AlkB
MEIIPGNIQYFKKDEHSIESIPGLRLIKNIITEQQEKELISFLNRYEWKGKGIEPNGELLRRTMQFGGLFRYKTRRMESFEPIPQELLSLLDIVPGTFNHIVVNEYEVGQGIMPHCDSTVLFGDTICSLSLLSDCCMDFITLQGTDAQTILFPRRSLLILQGPSRFDYKHSISKNEIDFYKDIPVPRLKRISITMRNVVINRAD